MEWVEKVLGEQVDSQGESWMEQEEVTGLGDLPEGQWVGWRKLGWFVEVCHHVEA